MPRGIYDRKPRGFYKPRAITMRMWCRRGHEMTYDNILIDTRGYTLCRACKRINYDDYRRRQGKAPQIRQETRQDSEAP